MFFSSKKRIVDSTYEELAVKTWEEARGQLQEFGERWIFRGQRKAEWMLETSLDREKSKESLGLPPDVAEARMLKDFQRRAHHFLTVVPTNDLEWLAMMQHYGAPTRLLDWTRSPFVAAYFAVERVKEDGECAVWCLDQDWCLDRSRDVLLKADPSLRLKFDPSDEDVFEKHIRFGGTRVVFPVEPFRLNERMTVQQGLFTCPGDVDVLFLDNLRALATTEGELAAHLAKVVMPGTIRAEALAELNQANVNRGTLFPGIEGLAQSLKYTLVRLPSLRKALLRSISSTRCSRPRTRCWCWTLRPTPRVRTCRSSRRGRL